MSTLNAYLGVAGLTDIGYRFYNLDTPVAARQTSGVTDIGDGWYGVTGVALAGDHVRWDSTGTAGAVAREDLSLRILTESRASQTSVDDIPTNAELATALGTADDAILAAIAALNNLSEANVRTAVGLAAANLDTQLDGLPTNAELATALAAADDAVLAAIAALNNLSEANVRTALGLAAANLDTQLSDVPAIKAKTDNLPGDPASTSDISAIVISDPLAVELPGTYADHTVGEILSRFDIVAPGLPLAAVPSAPPDTALCRVYSWFESLDNKPAKGVRISFRLVALNEPAMVMSERILSKKPIAVTTNAAGYMQIDLQRNDLLDPAGTKYQVTSEELGLDNKEITLTTSLFDLASVI